MAVYAVLLDQALQLSDEERGKLAARLLQSLDPDDDELSPEQWDDVWSAELDQRVREVPQGTVELIDGDEMLAELATPRRLVLRCVSSAADRERTSMIRVYSFMSIASASISDVESPSLWRLR